MATAISPELLKQLQGMTISDPYLNYGGSLYQPMFSQMQGESAAAPEMIGYAQYAPGAQIGDIWQQYDPSGEWLREAKLKPLDDGWMKLAIAAITGGAASGLFGGTLGVPGAPGIPGMGGGAGAGGFVGEGAASGIPGWDAALANAPAGGATSAAGFVGEAPWTATPNSSPLSFGGGAGAAGNAASGLIPGVTNSQMLGGAVSLLGGAAGAGGGGGGGGGGGMNPMVSGYVENMLPQVQSLLAQQAPMAQRNSQLLTDYGTSLLSRPVAGNPFLR